MVDIYNNYCHGESQVAKMITIYIEEAHAVDMWYLPESPDATTDAAIYSHRVIQDRMRAANRFIQNKSFPIEMVLDTMNGDVVDCYDAWPERLYIIVDGVVVYKGENGPFGYRLDEVKDWLAERYGMRGESIAFR